MYPGSSAPQIEPGSAQQPAAESSVAGTENAASLPGADDSIPAVPGTTSPAVATPPRTGDLSVAGRPGGTPWSRTPGTTFPLLLSGPLWSGARPLAQVFAAHPSGTQPAQPEREGKSRKKKRESTPPKHIRVPTDAAAAGELADRHRLRIVGFDTSGIGQEMVAQPAAAIDSVLREYPFVDLGGIEIAELGDRTSQVTRDRSDEASESASTGSWILLGRTPVANPAQYTGRSAPQ
ncbi:hypothetical protein [Nocardia sp. NPDC052112]|uniref:hypothetical protein n=1 Tax=Nocardia sp. NPDC052112 TaxID=3155646 RepID=UPI003439D04D